MSVKQSNKPYRREKQNPLTRDQYSLSAMAKSKRGQEAPASKLSDDDVESIRSSVRQRESLLKHIRENLSNKALMAAYGVCENTITRVVQYQNYGHLK